MATRRYKSILERLSESADPEERARLVVEFGEALEARFLAHIDQVSGVMAKIELDTRAVISQAQDQIASLRALMLKDAKADSEYHEKINHKLHSLSGAIMAINNKYDEQTELLHALIDLDALAPDNANAQHATQPYDQADRST